MEHALKGLQLGRSVSLRGLFDVISEYATRVQVSEMIDTSLAELACRIEDLAANVPQVTNRHGRSHALLGPAQF